MSTPPQSSSLPERGGPNYSPDKGNFQPVRTRAYVLILLFTVVVCISVAYAELVASRGGSVESVMLGAIPMAPAAIAVLMVLVAANAAVRAVSKKAGLNPAELAAIYFAMVCAAMVSSFGLAGLLLPNLMGVNYYANPQSHNWKTLFYPHIPKWMVPWDPAGSENQWVTQRFFEGLRVGEHVPWDAWIVPIVAWLAFALLLFFLMACVATLLRRQWVDNEKLSFPLVQLPMELANEGSRTSFLCTRGMWLGFAIPMLYHCVNGLHKSFPNVPELPTLIWIHHMFKDRPWSEMGWTGFIVTFSSVGFAYLLPLDVSFSMWFFLLFFRLQDVAASWLGFRYDLMPFYAGTRYYQGFQSAGAFVVLVVVMMWLARPHLRIVMQRVLSRDGPEVDKDEFMSYRTAFFGGVTALLLLSLWLKLAGMNAGVALFMICTFVFVEMLVLTRCVSEIGLLMLQPAVVPYHFWTVFASPSSLGASNLTSLAFVNGAFMRDPRNVMPVLMDSMKGADYVRAAKRKMALAVLLAVVLGAALALFIQIGIIYRYGGNQLNTWFFRTGCSMYFQHAESVLLGKPGYDVRAPFWFAVGGAFTLFLYAMRARFWWWPFHPLGYAIGCAWPPIVYWSMFFVGWLVKSLIMRYGGAPTYRRFRPFFLGLILGEFSAAILWAVLRGAFGLTTPNIAIQ